MRNLPGIAILAAFAASVTIITEAQNESLAFEVASVKLVNAAPSSGQRGANGVPGRVFDVQNHRFRAIRVTLYALLKWRWHHGEQLRVFRM